MLKLEWAVCKLLSLMYIFLCFCLMFLVLFFQNGKRQNKVVCMYLHTRCKRDRREGYRKRIFTTFFIEIWHLELEVFWNFASLLRFVALVLLGVFFKIVHFFVLLDSNISSNILFMHYFPQLLSIFFCFPNLISSLALFSWLLWQPFSLIRLHYLPLL